MTSIRRCHDVDLILDLDRRIMKRASLLGPKAVERGAWWVAYDGHKPIAYAGVCEGLEEWKGLGYMDRCGVLKAYRGQGIHRRMIKVRERWAKKQGWKGLWTYTVPWNAYSSNNLIACGWQLFEPKWISYEENLVCWVKCFDGRSWLDLSLAEGRPKRKKAA